MEILRGEDEAFVMGLRHACRSTECLGKRLLFLLDAVALVLGASRVGVAHQTSTTLVAKFVSSPLPRSPSLSADGLRQRIMPPTSHLVQNVGDRACIPMLTNGGRLQRGSAPDSELLAVLSAEAARAAGEETQVGNGRDVAPALVSPAKIEESSRSRREEREHVRARAHAAAASLACQHPLRRVFLPRTEQGHRSHGPALHGHAQRVSGICEHDAWRPKVVLLPKLDEMVVEVLEHLYFQGYGHGAADYLMAAVKFVGWVQSFSDLPRAVRALKRVSSVSAGNVSGLSPLGCCSGNDECSTGGERRICGDARGPVRGLLEAQRTVQSDGRPSYSSSSGVGREQLGSPLSQGPKKHSN